jgi:hypothetical protein
VAIPTFLKWAKNSSTLDSLVMMEKSKNVFTPMDELEKLKGEMLLRISMLDPDFSVMKLVSLQRNIHIPDSWHELIERLGINSFLSNSSTFIKECFDEYEPEKCIELQKHIISKLVDGIKDANELVYVSPIEVVVKYQKNGRGAIIKKLNEIFGMTSCIKFNVVPFRDGPVYDVLIEKDKSMELENKLIEIRKKKEELVASQNYEMAANIRDKERKIMGELSSYYAKQMGEQCVSENKNDSYTLRIEYSISNGEFLEIRKTLIDVPDSKFYTYFRTMILMEPLEEKDIVFMHEGKKAKWVIEEKHI